MIAANVWGRGRLFESSLTLTTVIAVVLNQLLRGGRVPAAAPAAAD